jgi:hypothetical protein
VSEPAPAKTWRTFRVAFCDGRSISVDPGEAGIHCESATRFHNNADPGPYDLPVPLASVAVRDLKAHLHRELHGEEGGRGRPGTPLPIAARKLKIFHAGSAEPLFEGRYLHFFHDKHGAEGQDVEERAGEYNLSLSHV